MVFRGGNGGVPLQKPDASLSVLPSGIYAILACGTPHVT